MRYGKLFICFITAALLMTAVFFGKREYAWDGTVCLSVKVTAQEKVEEIPCWKKSRGEYYVFLPSYADLGQVRLQTNTSNAVYLDGQQLTDGMTCENLRLDVPYDLCYLAEDGEHHFTVTFVQSGSVATLYIDTASGSMDHIHEVKGNEEPGTIRLYTDTGELDYAGNMESIKGRGNSTWGQPKKPYNLTLNTDGDLLGMGSAKRWVLLANAMDDSQMRNKVVYDFARDAGLDYSPECEWVDLYLNGEYAGLYLLSERNEVHSERVAIGEENSFLVSKDWEWRFRDNEQPYITTQANTALRIHYSDLPEDALLDIWQSAENAILAEDGIDPVTGKHWRELIDVDSWARKYLIEEIFGNSDGGILSQFFYYDGNDDGKIYAGPIWDFDLSMANATSELHTAPNGFFANRATIYASAWFPALYANEEFYSYVVQLYKAEFQPLLAQLLSQGMDAYAEQISRAAGINQLRWGSSDPKEETEAIQAFMTDRMEFLNGVWLENEESVYVLVREYISVLAYGLRPGECLPELPTYESNENTVFYGWYNMNTGEPIDVTQPIYEDTWIELRYEAVELPEAAEEETQEMQEMEEAEPEESPSLLRLGPAILLLGMLAGVCSIGLARSRQGERRIVVRK